MSDKKKSKPSRKAVYAGRRMAGDGKVYHRFYLLPEMKEMNFASTKSCWIGYTYTCWATQMLVRPERTDADHIQNAIWEAADAVVEASLQERKREKRMEKKSQYQIQRCVEELRPLVKSLNYFDTRSLMRVLIMKAQQANR